MKKSLVLAMAMALGVTASAYAANPFSDVPAGHWAYDAVNKLAAEGVVTGYPDGTFGGDKLMTRYEMAQIVAKAMANGANVDKLAAEFADELDSLGVRVANLEKKADNVKITGQIRASYRDADDQGHEGRLRTRLFVNGAINEDWTYTGRFENSQYYDAADDKAKTGDDEVKLNWAYVTGKVGGVKVMAGRQDFKLHTGNVIDATVDGGILSYGKDVKLTGYVGKAVDSGTWDNLDDVTIKDDPANALQEDDRVYAVDLSAKLGVVDSYVTYYKADTLNDNEIWNVGVALPVAKDLKLSAEYLHGDDQRDGDNNGWAAGLAYKGAKASTPGSWGIYANYFDQPQSTFLEHTIDGYAPFNFTSAGDGFEGYEVGANVALAKNIVAAVKYYDLDAREGSYDEQTLWSEVVFTF